MLRSELAFFRHRRPYNLVALGQKETASTLNREYWRWKASTHSCHLSVFLCQKLVQNWCIWCIIRRYGIRRFSSTPVKSSLLFLFRLFLLPHGLHGGESTQSSNASSHKLSQPSIFKGFRISGRMYLLAGFCIFTVNWCKKWCKFRCRTQVTAMDIFPSRRAKLSIFFSFVASL